jgi:uncharacterized protein (TIGR03790 family)
VALGCASPNPAGTTPNEGDPADVRHGADASGEGDPAPSVADGGVSGDGDATLPFSGQPDVVLPKSSLSPSELGVIVNVNDPQSVAVAAYYVAARKIPAANVVELAFTAETDALSPSTFAPLHAQATAALPSSVQALALTWTRPLRVGGMSITSAFAVGYDSSYAVACGAGKQMPTFDANTRAPWTDLAVRPTMMLAARTVEDAKAIIDRGIAADGTFPAVKAWLMKTKDDVRSVRASEYSSVVADWSGSSFVDARFFDASPAAVPFSKNFVKDETDIGFYFTGLANVAHLSTNTYVPGAIADHLTSNGGSVPDSPQMSALRWLEAGVGGSYGTVVEPCAWANKFPSARVAMRRYVRGETLVEAYFKSVRWPGQGLFIGEPLAKPWGDAWSFEGGTLTIRATSLVPGKTYELRAMNALGSTSFTVAKTITITAGAPVARDTAIVVEKPTAPVYQLVELP